MQKILTPLFFLIEEARSSNSAVLVHCLAGVSRSVTVTLAYLMRALDLCLNDAFTLVRDRKPDVSPNFHFMQQLHSFERQLGLNSNECTEMDDSSIGSASTTLAGSPKSGVSMSLGSSHCNSSKFSCNCIATDCKCIPTPNYIAQLAKAATGISPDSGIEFDRWTPSADTGLKWEQLVGKSFVLPPNNNEPPMAINADNVSPASTNSSSTSTNTTAEAVSVIELHHRNAKTTEE